MIIMSALISVTLPFILIYINSFLFKKELNSREKVSPFECGFDPKSTSRIPFSIRFYMIAIIFLIFDIEITLILPIPMLLALSNFKLLTFLSVVFITILLGGLLLEWNQGALNWAN